MAAVLTERLSKRYGDVEVLHQLNLEVPRGRLFGFLGPNGAGKTTTIRLLLGLLKATSGRARVLGHDTQFDGREARAQIGYLPGDVRFYDGMTCRATLDFFDRCRGGGHGREVTRLASVFDLDLRKRVRDCSRGMKQKLGLIQALMHRPALLILDEPTTALDPLVKETLNQELRSVAGDGRTVLFSSHTLSEVEELCDEVAIVRAGRLIECERVAVLRERAVRHVEAKFAGDFKPTLWPDGLRIESYGGGFMRAAWLGPADRLLAWLVQNGVIDVSIAPPDLEDLFLSYYAEEPATGASVGAAG